MVVEAVGFRRPPISTGSPRPAIQPRAAAA
jgi:hypothetical protein